MPAAAPFQDLSRDQMRELLLRLRLYAQWKVRATCHRDPSLDPQDLALKAIADTLDGTRRWNRERFDLLRHLTNCVDSYVSHGHASARARHEDARHDGAALADAAPSPDPGPEEHLSLDREVRDLCAWVATHHPRLEALLRLVVEEGMSLADRQAVARALGLDPQASDQMQRAYRQINALKSAVAQWRAARGEARS